MGVEARALVRIKILPRDILSGLRGFDPPPFDFGSTLGSGDGDPRTEGRTIPPTLTRGSADPRVRVGSGWPILGSSGRKLTALRLTLDMAAAEL